MSESTAPKIPKWPFIVGDVALLLTAIFLLSRIEGEFGILEAFWCLACVAGGAWIMVMPYLKEFQARTDLTEARELANSCLLYTSPSPRDATLSRMPSSA